MKNALLIAVATLVSIQSIFGFQVIESCQKPGDFALTFDDGPSIEHTGLILDILKKENVKATFFVNGNNCVDVANTPTAQELIKREYAEGHNIASHTLNHPAEGITKLTDKQVLDEIKGLNDLLFDLIGVKPNFFRPPLGEVTEANGKIIDQEGIKAIINWNLDSNDWKEADEIEKKGYATTNATANYLEVLDQSDPTQTSLIALNHDINDVTAKRNLELMIPIIKARGWRFVTMDECLGISTYQNINSLENKSVIQGNTTVTTTMNRAIPTITTTVTVLPPDPSSNLNEKKNRREIMNQHIPVSNKTLDLADCRDQWFFDEKYQVWCLEDILYTLKATTPKFQRMSIFVPAKYMNKNGTVNEEGMNGDYNAKTAPVIFAVHHFDTLALKLAEQGIDTDYALVWDLPHCEADYPGEICDWINSTV
ncbi:glycoside hydrolase/deacetylase [Anaeromyces robustus]|uniref:Glycoside hydrolase/deacetylase n=1 Tax=Anaeromyces robustus TaxID=1754192 RepID=A0A1Y1VXP1_9FUNG|nr:glycoside hydrolase/deacetylase [Anaeromyces robustus]|eukprot:ORX65564.1 glycoside hydrolase/deacetylase [Anaeromyces robustus]